MHYQQEPYDIDEQMSYARKRDWLEDELRKKCSSEVMTLVRKLVEVEVQYTVNGLLNDWKQRAIAKIKAL